MSNREEIIKQLKEDLDLDIQINEDLEQYINYILDKDIFDGDECSKIVQAFETMNCLTEKDLYDEKKR